MVPFSLKGEKVTLRAPEMEDLDVLYAWENDTSIWPVSNTISPFSKNVLRAYLELQPQDIFETKQLRFMITDHDGRAVGCIDLFDFDPHARRAGVGILVAAGADRKKGFAADSLEVLKKYCFEVLLLHQIYCHIGTENEASRGLFEKAGFVVCGIKKEWNPSPTGWKDELMMQCITNIGAV